MKKISFDIGSLYSRIDGGCIFDAEEYTVRITDADCLLLIDVVDDVEKDGQTPFKKLIFLFGNEFCHVTFRGSHLHRLMSGKAFVKLCD